MRTEFTPEMRAKLPKAAQRHIDMIESRLASARREIEDRDGKYGPSNVVMVEGMAEVSLPRDAKVRYRLGDHSWITIYPERDKNGPFIKLMASYVMSLIPMASNVVEARDIK